MIRVDRDIYIKTTTEDGVEVEPPEQMSSNFVQSWLKSSSFFDSLVDSPEVHKKLKGGVIEVTQTTPWGAKRIVTFTPKA